MTKQKQTIPPFVTAMCIVIVLFVILQIFYVPSITPFVKFLVFTSASLNLAIVLSPSPYTTYLPERQVKEHPLWILNPLYNLSWSGDDGLTLTVDLCFRTYTIGALDPNPVDMAYTFTFAKPIDYLRDKYPVGGGSVDKAKDEFHFNFALLMQSWTPYALSMVLRDEPTNTSNETSIGDTNPFQ